LAFACNVDAHLREALVHDLSLCDMRRRLLTWALFGAMAHVGCEHQRNVALQVTTPAEASPLAPSVQAKPRPQAPQNVPPLQLVLATWNVEWLNRHDGRGPVKRQRPDYARLEGYARRLAADVIALQEIDGDEAAARVFNPKLYDFHFARGGGAQRAGFAWRRGLSVGVNADFEALDVGGVRAGADLSVHTANGTLRLLGVHLKSGCFSAALTDSGKACSKLSRQLPELERWIDARAREVEAHAKQVDASDGKTGWRGQTRWFAVLGDFNRRLFAQPTEPFWRELDDAEPPEADLDSPTRTVKRSCWGTRDVHGVDHLVLARSLATRVIPDSFQEHSFLPADASFKAVMSDHCPLSVSVRLD
jgi:endonuclease/exonuclease/phosphatase family metal-dependent hydrolase